MIFSKLQYCDSVQKTNAVNGNVSFSELAKYPYELLCRKAELPDGIDPSHKEVSLHNYSCYLLLYDCLIILRYFS